MLIRLQFLLWTATLCLLPGLLLGQSALDAIRFGQYNPIQTARIHATGGANTSLGGDLSSAYTNPAGLAQYKTNELVFTPGFQIQSNRMNYSDSTFKKRRSVLNNGAWGIILSAPSAWKSSPIRNKTISFSINQTANFNSNFFYRGVNERSSYSEKWVEELSANQVSNFDDALYNFPSGSSLAAQNYLVDSIQQGNQIIGYRTNANIQNMPLNQSFLYSQRGGIQEFTFGISWNLMEKWLYGFSIGMPYVDFRLRTTVTERDISGNTNNDFGEFTYSEDFSSTGLGMNGRLGVIYKPVEYVRLGFSFHTPTLYSITDRTTASLRTDVENYARRISGEPGKASVFEFSTADITGEEKYSYNYQVTTPWRAALSASYVFRETKEVPRQKAFITGDLELVNYRSMSYSASSEPLVNSPGTAYFKSVNRDIDAIYRYALNGRIGGELKFKIWMIRAGFNYTGSPYKRSALPERLRASNLTPSLGLGYRHKGIFIDLSGAHSFGRNIHFPYLLSGNSYPYAKQRINGTQIVATVGFKF